jgi:hypothetical protein
MRFYAYFSFPGNSRSGLPRFQNAIALLQATINVYSLYSNAPSTLDLFSCPSLSKVLETALCDIASFRRLPKGEYTVCIILGVALILLVSFFRTLLGKSLMSFHHFSGAFQISAARRRKARTVEDGPSD